MTNSKERLFSFPHTILVLYLDTHTHTYIKLTIHIIITVYMIYYAAVIPLVFIVVVRIRAIQCLVTVCQMFSQIMCYPSNINNNP